MKFTKSKQFILLETIFYLHTGVIGAVYTLYLLSLGLTIFQANLVSSIFNIASIVFEVPSGAMCDSIGKRKTAIFSGITLGIAMLCFFIAKSIPLVIIGQLLWGISYALESGTIEAWLVNDGSLRGNELDAVFASSQKIQSIVMIIGSFVGTWMADYSLNLIWILPLVSALIFTLLVFCFVSEDGNRSNAQSICELYSTTLKYIKDGSKLIINYKPLTYIFSLTILMGFVSSPLMVFWSVYLNEMEPTFSYMYLSTVWLLIQISIIVGNQLLEWTGKYFDRKKYYFLLSASLVSLQY